MKNYKKTFIIFACLSLTNLSCADNYEKKVYFDLKVGGSKASADKFYDKFREENNPDRISKYPFYKHRLQSGTYYYSSPLYLYPPNDTIIHTVDIYYFINPKDGDNIIETTKDGLLSMSIDDNYDNVTPQIVLNDVLREIKSKYGEPDVNDTLDYKKPFHVINSWKNKDGINVSLDYAFSDEYFHGPVKYYNIKLQFTLTDELKSKLIKNKSIY